jgi:hypothetical protein
MEVWPGGRYNHYIFDLNDWAWQTQLESQQRLALYNEWLPQMHVDVHEMGYNSPIISSLHQSRGMNILRNMKDFHNTLGAKIASKFDAENGYNTENDLICFI